LSTATVTGVPARRGVARSPLGDQVIEREPSLDSLAQHAAELSPPRLVDLGLEHAFHLEEVDGHGVVGREGLGREDRESRERDGAGDRREQALAVGGHDQQLVRAGLRAGLRRCSHLGRADVGGDRRVVPGDAVGLDREEVPARHAEHEAIDGRIRFARKLRPHRFHAGGELVRELETHVAAVVHPVHAGDQLTQQRLAPRGPRCGPGRGGVGLREQREGGEPLGRAHSRCDIEHEVLVGEVAAGRGVG
jgi:hypothetical protein